MIVLASTLFLAAASLAMPLGAHAADSHEIARGKYLVTVGSCTDCHTPGSFFGKPDMSKYLGGSDVGFAIPHLGVFVGPNLTPDKATGLGNWTDYANRRCDYERANAAGPHAGAGHAVARLTPP